MMRSGSLRHSVTIQKPVYSVNASGDVIVSSWQPVASVRAAVRHVTANEADRFARLQTVVTHNVTIRWMDGIDETMRMVWGTKILSIAEIGLDPTARRMINMKCAELKPDTWTEPVPESSSALGSSSSSSGSFSNSEVSNG